MKDPAHTASDVTVKVPACALLEHVLVMLAHLHVVQVLTLPLPTLAHATPTPIVPLAIAHHQTSVPIPVQSARALDHTMMDVTAHRPATVSLIHVQHPICVPPPAVGLPHTTMTVDVPATPSVVQVSALRQPTHANQLA